MRGSDSQQSVCFCNEMEIPVFAGAHHHSPQLKVMCSIFLIERRNLPAAALNKWRQRTPPSGSGPAASHRWPLCFEMEGGRAPIFQGGAAAEQA